VKAIALDRFGGIETIDAIMSVGVATASNILMIAFAN
jgi:hypothetical protein